MEQHVHDRDYVESRVVIDQVKKWRDYRSGDKSRLFSIEEFANDPFGEKKRTQAIADVNEALKREIYENRISQHKAKG